MIGQLSIVIKFKNQMLGKKEFKEFREMANKNLLVNFIKLFGSNSNNELYLLEYYKNNVKNQNIQFIEELFSHTNNSEIKIYQPYSFNEENLEQPIECTIEHTIEYDILSFECNLDQYKLIELALNKYFPTYNDLKAYHLPIDQYLSKVPIYHPLLLYPQIDLEYLVIDHSYMIKNHPECDIGTVIYTPQDLPIKENILKKYIFSYLEAHDCSSGQLKEKNDNYEELSIVTDFHKFLETDLIRQKLKNELLNYTKSKEFQKSSNVMILEVDKILKFKSLSLAFSNTLYNFHQKTEAQKKDYLFYRSLSSLLFNHLIQYSYNVLDAAFAVIEYLSKSIKSFAEIDYYLELLFYDDLAKYRKQLMNYWILSVIKPDTVVQMRMVSGSEKLEMLHKSVDITGIELGNKKYIKLLVDDLRVKQNNQIIQMSVNEIYQKYQNNEEFEILNIGKRKVGDSDKSLGTTIIRNSLADFFPLLCENFSLTKSDIEEEDDDNLVYKVINNSFTLEYNQDAERVFLSIYQLMNSLLPYYTKKDFSITKLTQESNVVDLYNNKVIINFNSKMPNSFPRLKDLTENRKVTITSLPPRFHHIFMSNLIQLQSNLDDMFDLPTYRLNYFGIQIKLTNAKSLFSHFNDYFGGDQHFINLTQISNLTEDLKEDLTMLVKKAGYDNNYAYLQIHFKREYIEKYFRNIVDELKEIEEFMILRGVLQAIEEIEKLEIDKGLKIPIIEELDGLKSNLL